MLYYILCTIRAHPLYALDSQFSRRTNVMRRRLFVFFSNHRTPTGSAHVVTKRTQYTAYNVYIYLILKYLCVQ